MRRRSSRPTTVTQGPPPSSPVLPLSSSSPLRATPGLQQEFQSRPTGPARYDTRGLRRTPSSKAAARTDSPTGPPLQPHDGPADCTWAASKRAPASHGALPVAGGAVSGTKHCPSTFRAQVQFEALLQIAPSTPASAVVVSSRLSPSLPALHAAAQAAAPPSTAQETPGAKHAPRRPHRPHPVSETGIAAIPVVPPSGR